MAKLSSYKQDANLETFTLIWLDSLVNTSEDNIDTKILLKKANNRLKTFEDSDKCIEYIQSASQERIVLIVSGRLGQEIVSHIHHLSQLIAIYVYCSDKKRNEVWARHFTKIKGVIVDLIELISCIKNHQIKRNEYKIDERLPISIFHTKSHKIKSVAINNDNFIHFQLLIDYLSRMKSDEDDKKQFILLCRNVYEGIDNELNVIQEFEEKYSSDRAIWWFTRESFICHMLNKAFQIIDIDLLYCLHFFIRDIRRQLKENKCLSLVRTYRAQLMLDEEIKSLKYSIGELLSINTFLSTIPDRERAISILEQSDKPNHLKKVLFEIDADPRVCDIKAFSDITSLNYFHGVEIMLFMAGTIFCPVDIRQEKDVFIIQMEISSDNDQKIKPILESLKDECYNNEINLLSFGNILTKMKKFDNARKYYYRLLEEMPNDHQSVACCYQQLGHIEMEKENYDSSIQFYQKALDINRAILRSDDSEIAVGYSTIANVYVKKGAFIEAVELYTEALQIWSRALGKDHPKVGIGYKNMAYAYDMDKRYYEAIEYYHKALIIRERNFPADDPDLAKLHNDIGCAYFSLDDMTQALKHYKTALKILKKVDSFKSPDVIMIAQNIGLAYEAIGNLTQALRQFEKVALLRKQILPPDHPDISRSVQDIQRISSQLK